jgi:hypothetical protein
MTSDPSMNRVLLEMLVAVVGAVFLVLIAFRDDNPGGGWS